MKKRKAHQCYRLETKKIVAARFGLECMQDLNLTDKWAPIKKCLDDNGKQAVAFGSDHEKFSDNFGNEIRFPQNIGIPNYHYVKDFISMQPLTGTGQL